MQAHIAHAELVMIVCRSEQTRVFKSANVALMGNPVSSVTVTSSFRRMISRRALTGKITVRPIGPFVDPATAGFALAHELTRTVPRVLEVADKSPKTADSAYLVYKFESFTDVAGLGVKLPCAELDLRLIETPPAVALDHCDTGKPDRINSKRLAR